MSDLEEFARQRTERIRAMSNNESLQQLGIEFAIQGGKANYTYNFDWLGLPIIQVPQDVLALQEIIWRTKPDIILETGIARGGSLIFSASMLQLLNGPGKVIGIDIDIRPHNRAAIEAHPLAHRIAMLQGSAIDPAIAAQAKAMIPTDAKVMVVLDSNHTHAHVLEELALYSPLVSKDCYLVVMDSTVDDLPPDAVIDRPWGPGDNPKTALYEFLKTNDRFEIDREIDAKLVISVARQGYLKCLK